LRQKHRFYVQEVWYCDECKWNKNNTVRIYGNRSEYSQACRREDRKITLEDFKNGESFPSWCPLAEVE
jgi:hypothetical protein